jgi:glycerol kinase
VPLPLTAAVCDQQAALVGHGIMRPGGMKVTYGTGAFVLSCAGADPPRTDELETSIGWRNGSDPVEYVVQGGVLSASSLLAWLGDELGLGLDPFDAGRLAESVAGDPGHPGVRLLPAPAGLGAPWYRADARVVIEGLGFGTGRADIARAALDAIAHRVADIVEATARATGTLPVSVRADGGLSRVGYLTQRQADLLGVAVELAEDPDSTARGTAMLAAAGAGLRPLESWPAPEVERVVGPRLDGADRLAERRAWMAFVESCLARLHEPREGPSPA